ncbi:hypothetical protein B4Q13_14870 [Lacticaseibacillus rhamnosus]
MKWKANSQLDGAWRGFDLTAAQRPIALVILDGWGYAPRTEGNAIAVAHTPNYDAICRDFPMTTLAAAGASGGPPAGARGTPAALCGGLQRARRGKPPGAAPAAGSQHRGSSGTRAAPGAGLPRAAGARRGGSRTRAPG